ncbi:MULTISPECIES: AAA family ATPase [Aquimarina]|uniref:AAA family ATPase n=1 Tax=Aquimarina TaxID=290174 RepID=UPI0009454857|nr:MULTISPECIES: AAA family ATPase [Aquimarina]
MKIHIFGASGSGTTTLANNLEQRLGWKHLDADDYYWKKTDPPFQVKIPLLERNIAIKKDIEIYDSVIISGSMVSWGKEWESMFDYAVFLYIPPEVRIQRLINREVARYGVLLQTDAEIQSKSKAFLDWAKQYDDPTFDGRSLTVHKNWIKRLKCPVIQIEGDTTIEERIAHILLQIHKKNSISKK